MHNPTAFAETHLQVLHELMRQHPLATLVSCGADGPEATHVPVVLHSGLGEKGTLRCHFARANEHWKSIQSAPSVLAVFQGPDHYITPSWYPIKQRTGKAVPTWNYVAVHVRGTARIFEDRDELLSHLRALTTQSERHFERPWTVDDAPRDYLEAMAKGIVGIEIPIREIQGKWKVSQNRSLEDRRGVAAGLEQAGTVESREIAGLVTERLIREE